MIGSGNFNGHDKMLNPKRPCDVCGEPERDETEGLPTALCGRCGDDLRSQYDSRGADWTWADESEDGSESPFFWTDQ